MEFCSMVTKEMDAITATLRIQLGQASPLAQGLVPDLPISRSTKPAMINTTNNRICVMETLPDAKAPPQKVAAALKASV